MHQSTLSTAFAAAVLSSAIVAAQAPGSSAAPQSRGTTTGERVTLTGCVERADQLNPAGGNTLGTTLDSQDFVLMKAEPAGASHSDPASSVGTSGTVGPLYRLIGDDVRLNPHVGQKVEVSGTREGTSAADAAAQAANAPNTSSANAPAIKVESIKVLSETCPR